MSRFRLVIAGHHQQYLDWLASVNGSPAEYRPFDEVRVRGITARDVVSFDQVGTYWEHPGWGGAVYRQLMDEGLSLDRHWAMPWDVDYMKAAQLQARPRNLHPVSEADVTEAIARQKALEDRLGPHA